MKLALIALCLISLLPLLYGLELADVQQALGMPQTVDAAKQLNLEAQQERTTDKKPRNLDSLRGLG